MTNGRWDMIAELNTESLAGFSRALDAVRLVEGGKVKALTLVEKMNYRKSHSSSAQLLVIHVRHVPSMPIDFSLEHGKRAEQITR